MRRDGLDGIRRDVMFSSMQTGRDGRDARCGRDGGWPVKYWSDGRNAGRPVAASISATEEAGGRSGPSWVRLENHVVRSLSRSSVNCSMFARSDGPSRSARDRLEDWKRPSLRSS